MNKIIICKPLLVLTMLTFSVVTFSQANKNPIVNGAFPNKWDTEKTLRHKNGKVLIWVRYRYEHYKESRSCLILDLGVDTNGGTYYKISVKYTNKKPFNDWHFGWTHYLPMSGPSGVSKEYFVIHSIRFDHKPTIKELNNLFSEWGFSITRHSAQLIEAGIDEKLWLNTLGYLPDRKILCNE